MLELNKKNILRFSLASFCLASLLGIFIAINVDSAQTAGRTGAVASIFGVLGISSFFVGLAFPKEG